MFSRSRSISRDARHNQLFSERLLPFAAESSSRKRIPFARIISRTDPVGKIYCADCRFASVHCTDLAGRLRVAQKFRHTQDSTLPHMADLILPTLSSFVYGRAKSARFDKLEKITCFCAIRSSMLIYVYSVLYDV